MVGVPALPPASAVAAVERARHRLGAVHRGVVPPPVRVIEALLGSIDAAALGALCALEIPDHLDGPLPMAVLTEQVGADHELVERLVAYAAARGWLRLDRAGRVRPTRTTRFLRRDHPGGWRAWVDFATGPEVFAALAALANDPTVADPFTTANGSPFFTWQQHHEDRHGTFDAAMAAGGRLHGFALAGAIDWSTVRRVCDVGGGTGALLHTLIGEHPHLHGVVLDLPAVVARGEATERLELVGGDAFVNVVPGCDAYLLVNVVHDWDDSSAVALLSRVAAARAAGGRVIVVEHLRRARAIDGIALRSDLLMLALTPGGRERTGAEIAALGTRAGLRLEREVPLVSGDCAYLFI